MKKSRAKRKAEKARLRHPGSNKMSAYQIAVMGMNREIKEHKTLYRVAFPAGYDLSDFKL